MIPTLTVSHLINKENYSLIPGIKAFEYREPRPILDQEKENLFHSNYGIIQEEFIDYFNSILSFLLENNIKMFSFDLGPAVAKVEVQNSCYSARSKLLSKSQLQKEIRSRLNYVKRNFHGDIALENLNYFPTDAYEHVCEPDFMSDVLRKNDVYFVLDIAHAIVAAHNMKLDKYEYISCLPLERIKEIHLSAPGINGKKWQDLHEQPGAEEFGILDFISKRITFNPYLVIECYRDFFGLLEIYKVLNDRNKALLGQ